ncbi:MAG TPA: hypothetical protein VJ183_09015 [Chloroflexia bacterium]|nr:hypothetical protein [Chloroflexia bacterium]
MVGANSDAPQLSQNASPGRAAAAHTGHTTDPRCPLPLPPDPPERDPCTSLTGVPQASQNATPSGSSIPQFGQYIAINPL